MEIKLGCAQFAHGSGQTLSHRLDWRAASILACILTLCLSCTTTINRPSDPVSVAVFTQFEKVRTQCRKPGTAELNYLARTKFFRETKRTPWDPEPMWIFDPFDNVFGAEALNGARPDFACFARAGDQMAAYLIIIDMLAAGRDREALVALEAEVLTYVPGVSTDHHKCRNIGMPIAFHCPYGQGRVWLKLGELRYKLNRDRAGALAALEIASDIGFYRLAWGEAAKIKRDGSENPE